MVQDKSKFLQWKFTKSFGAGNPISPPDDIFAFHHISELDRVHTGQGQSVSSKLVSK